MIGQQNGRKGGNTMEKGNKGWGKEKAYALESRGKALAGRRRRGLGERKDNVRGGVPGGKLEILARGRCYFRGLVRADWQGKKIMGKQGAGIKLWRTHKKGLARPRVDVKRGNTAGTRPLRRREVGDGEE